MRESEKYVAARHVHIRQLHGYEQDSAQILVNSVGEDKKCGSMMAASGRAERREDASRSVCSRRRAYHEYLCDPILCEGSAAGVPYCHVRVCVRALTCQCVYKWLFTCLFTSQFDYQIMPQCFDEACTQACGHACIDTCIDACIDWPKETASFVPKSNNGINSSFAARIHARIEEKKRALTQFMPSRPISKEKKGAN